MTLLELCEPLFKKVCLLNRLGRKGASLSTTIDPEKLRFEIKELFLDIEKRASAEAGLSAQWQKLELPMIFFVDSMIAECGLTFPPHGTDNRLAYERKELAGDEKFFDLLDETLNDPSDEATERLQIFLHLPRTWIYRLVRRVSQNTCGENARYQPSDPTRDGYGSIHENLPGSLYRR